jgi:hypothetical protein
MEKEKRQKDYMAWEPRHGVTHHALGPHPRKALLERTGYKNATKMYVDVHQKDGTTKAFHCGYVIGPYWFSLYEVEPFRKEA